MRALRIALVLAAAGLPIGCRQKSRGFTLDQLTTFFSGTSERDLVVQMFEPKDPDVRRAAIEKLSGKKEFHREPYLKAYALLAGDPDPSVRAAAYRALGMAGDAAYLETIAAGMKDTDRNVRWDAAVALSSVHGEAAIGPLSHTARSDPDVDVRSAAVRALGQYRRADVVETLLRCLDDRQFAVRFWAGHCLKEMTGADGKTDPRRWRELLSAKGELFAPPPKPAKPWWDVFGMTGRRAATTQPSTRPAEVKAAKPPPEPEAPRRTQWDQWVEATRERFQTPPTPASMPPAPQQRPPVGAWWKWLEETRRDFQARSPASPRPQ